MTVRVGVVGTAYWASDIHVPGLMATPGVEVVGLHGRSREKAKAIAARHGIQAFARYEDMLEAVDAVSIAISPHAQPAFAIEAADRGRHLLLEKPIATSLDVARELTAHIERSGVAAIVFFVRRFIPEVAAAISENAGKPWLRARVTVHSAPLTTASPYRDSVWRQEDGAALWDIGPHALSVLVPMMGPVVGSRRLPAPARHVRFETRHAGGGTAQVSLTLHAQPGETMLEYRFEGSEGELVLPDPDFSRPEALSRAARDLVGLIGSGRRDHPCGIGLGLETVKWLAALEGGEAPGEIEDRS